MLTICGIDHVVLRVADIERMRKFYCEVLGAQHVVYRSVAHLKTPGVEGNGISIYINDPEGNIVELKGPSDGKAAP